MSTRMMRRGPLLLAVAAALSLAGSAAAGAASCIYASKSYSTGAFVCVQKSLMLTCQADGAHAAWAVVAEKDMADRCVAPTPFFQRHLSQRVNYHPQSVPISRDRCFNFAGRRYCE